jgi:ribonuclease P protein component
VHRDGITVFAVRREDDGPMRVGLAVDKGVGAVQRNRVKRRLRSALAHCASSSGFDVVVRGGRELTNKDFQLLVSDLREAVITAEGRAR